MKFEVKEVNQFLINPNALFYGKRMLSPDAEEFIIDKATQNSLSDRIHIRIYLHGDETGRKDEIPTAIHQHFTYRRKKSERKLKKVLQLGWQSLIISIVFFGFLISLTIVILKLFPEGGLSIVLAP